MLRNSQISHILLLVVLGFAIYYLTSPKKTIKNTGTLEELSPELRIENNQSEDSEEENVLQKVAQENNNVSEERGIVSEVEEELNMNEEELNMNEEELNMNRSESEEERAQPHSFKPNETDGGANLQNAFGRPVPEGTNTNTVDFNKNYLKKYDSKNYLPQEVNDEWFDTDFTQAKNKVDSDKLINTESMLLELIL